MEIIIGEMKTLSVQHGKECIDFRFSVWGAMRPECQEGWFGPTNRYLKTLPKENLDTLFECYKQAKLCLEEPATVDEMVKTLNVIVNTMSEQVNYYQALKWANENGQLDIDTTTAVTPPPNSSPETTFSRSECYELSCLAMLVKIIAPIAGLMCKVISGAVGNDFKEPDTARIIAGTGFSKMPPYCKLTSYCDALADRRQTNMSTAVAYKMPTNALGNYILSLAVIRRLMPAALKGSNQGILSFCYNFIQAKMDKLRNGYSDKHSSGGADDNDSFIDHYRISEDVTTCIRTCTEAYLSNTPRLAYDMKIGHRAADCQALLLDLIDSNIEVSELHTPFLGHILGKCIHRWIVDVINRHAKLSAIAVASIWLEEKGYQDLAALLASPRRIKEATNMRLSADGPIMVKLPVDLEQELLTRYPYLPDGAKNQNPGLVLIDRTVKYIAAHEWPLVKERNVDMSNIRSSIARLLITHKTN